MKYKEFSPPFPPGTLGKGWPDLAGYKPNLIEIWKNLVTLTRGQRGGGGGGRGEGGGGDNSPV